MSVPKRIIYVMLVPVGPRSSEWPEQKFAMITVAGIESSAALGESERARFMPWNWGRGAIRVFAPANGQWVEGAVEELDTKRLPERIVPDMLEKVRAWFERPSIDLHLHTSTEVEGHKPIEPTLAEQLTYVAGMLGVIPQELGIVRYLSLRFPATLPADAPYFAVPVISDGTTVRTPGGPSSPPATSTDEVRWLYDGAETDLATEARSLGAWPRGGTSDGKLGPDLGTHWIRAAKLEAVAWTEDLVQRCRDATHLFARISDCLRRFPTTERLSRYLAIVGLSCYGSADPQKRLNALARVSPTPPPSVELPIKWTNAVQSGLSLSSTSSTVLLELDKSVADDALVWLWRGASGEVASALRDGASAEGLGAAASHRAYANELVQKLVALQLPDVLDQRRTLTRTHVQALFDAACARVTPDDSAVSVELQTYQNDQWSRYLDTYVTELWNAAPRSVEQRPSGLSIQLDEVRGGAVADTELWNELAGVGVLLRRKPAGSETWGPWRSLDVARLEWRVGEAWSVDNVMPAWFELFEGSAAERLALVPVRLPVRDGLRHPFLVYEHKSLVAKNPLDDQIGKRLGDQKVESATSELAAQLRYAEPNSTVDSAGIVKAALLPPLVFGDVYQLAAFAIDLAGGMPAEVTAPGAPWRHRMLEPAPAQGEDVARGAFGLGPDDVPAVARTSELTYKRRVPIGSIGVARTDRTNEPDVPDGVRPLARELERPERRPDPLVVRRHSQTTQLLALQVGLPTVDIDLLERSIGIVAAKPSRVHWLENLHVPKTAEDKPNAKIETAFVDPSVEQITIRLQQHDLSRDADPWQDIDSDVIDAAVLTTDKRLPRALSISAKFASSESQPGRIVTPGASTAASPQREVVVPKGADSAVFRIVIEVSRITAHVFEPEALPHGDPIRYCIMIERASNRCPLPTQLASWFQIGVAVDEQGRPQRAVRTWLASATDPEFAPLVRNLTTAEVLRHPWRWLGRPRPRWKQPGLDTATAQPWATVAEVVDRTDDDVRRWEETAFIDLDPTGMTIPPETRRLPVGRVWREPTEAEVSLLVDDRSATKQSQYIRYSVRVASRYASLYDLDSVESFEAREVRGTSRRYVAWRAIYFPVALDFDPAPPVVLAALPLTRDADDPGVDADIDSPAGVLVAFDEIAFQTCGISEGVVAEVKVATDHFRDANGTLHTEVLPEYGRSVIHTNEVWDKAPWSNAKTPGERLLALDGPYGFTLEPSSPEPLFTSSAYVLKPPFSDAKDRNQRSRAWDMMRVRFQRVVHDEPGYKPKSAETSWTKPAWLQLGANGKALLPDRPRLVNDVLSGLPRTPAQDPKDARAFYAAVTRSIYNVQGGTRDELYVATALVKDGEATISALAGMPHDVTLFVRILEVQRAMPPNSQTLSFPANDDLWLQLFPKDDQANDSTEPRFRIIRVSPRRAIRRE